jgi:hypothetical protein
VASFAHLALLLDPRLEYRAFFRSERVIFGSVEKKNSNSLPNNLKAVLPKHREKRAVWRDLLP